jgi:ABC-type branched-subunit amino acid transport system ATPase component/ABC-type branched-subunit amino acid transport system permease subunit
MIEILTNESFLALVAIYCIAALGMNVVYVTGQLNLGQGGFFAIGAYAVGYSNAELGLALVPSLVLAAACAALVALPVAAACARLRGIYLIMGTLAIGELVRIAAGNVEGLGGVEGYTGMAPVENGAIYLTLVVLLLAVVALMASPLGLQMRSLFDDQDAAAAAGVPTRRIRALAVIISAAIVAAAGGLFARSLLFISPDDFGVRLSFEIALFTLVGGVHSVIGALLGAAGITTLLELLRRIDDIEWVPDGMSFLADWRLVVYGALVMATMALLPEGLVSRRLALRMSQPLRRLRRRRAPSAGGRPGAVPATEGGPAPLLRLEGLRRHFGSVVALDRVSLDVQAGTVLALIGANGAGKSTLVDCVSGRYRIEAGTVALNGVRLERLRPERRVSAGLARTFQSVRTFAHLTVEENLRLGRSATGGRPAPSVDELAGIVGMSGQPGRLAADLTLGEQRRLEIGRSLASAPQVLFLDEPSAGMTDAERGELAQLIAAVRARGVGIVLIDHNLDLALGVADHVAVLDFGCLIAQADPATVLKDPRVRAAYLGSAEGAPA